MDNELKEMIGKNEKVVYEGKPDKKCFIFEGIFNPLLPIAVLWGLFDSFFLMNFLNAGNPEVKDDGMVMFLVVFFALHLLPVWLYLGGILLIMKKFKNAYYVVTDKAVYLSEGALAKRYSMTLYTEVIHVDLHRGVFDRKFNVGDVVLTTKRVQRNSSGKECNVTVSISDIAYYLDVYKVVKMLHEKFNTGK